MSAYKLTPEGEIKKQIMEYLNKLPGCYARVIQVSGIRGRVSPSKGISDIIGVYHGRFLAIEVKTETGRLSPEQEKFLDMIKRFGGIAIVARSLDDVVTTLKPHQTNTNGSGLKNTPVDKEIIIPSL